MIDRYILDENGDPVLCPSLKKWGVWMGTAKRRIGETYLSDGSRVSTVFLGLDHRIKIPRSLGGDGVGPPVLFETMVFQPKGPSDGDKDPFDFAGIDQRRYCTRAEAVAGHAQTVAYWEGKLAETAEKLGQLVGTKIKEPG